MDRVILLPGRLSHRLARAIQLIAKSPGFSLPLVDRYEVLPNVYVQLDMFFFCRYIMMKINKHTTTRHDVIHTLKLQTEQTNIKIHSNHYYRYVLMQFHAGEGIRFIHWYACVESMHADPSNHT